MAASLDGAGLRAFHDALLAAHGPQGWWPIQDADNPRFEVLVGAVLTQHTAWVRVEQALVHLCAAGPLTAETLLAHGEALSDLLRQAGSYRIKAQRLRALCRWFVAAGGFAALERRDTETLRRELLGLHGIGPETADVILLYAFQRPRFVADGYAFRIFERYGWSVGPRRYERLCRDVGAALPDADAQFHAELHALIVAHAKQRCHKRQPDCTHCVLQSRCRYGRATVQQ